MVIPQLLRAIKTRTFTKIKATEIKGTKKYFPKTFFIMLYKVF